VLITCTATFKGENRGEKGRGKRKERRVRIQREESGEKGRGKTQLK
jgi:hypothetical protein